MQEPLTQTSHQDLRPPLDTKGLVGERGALVYSLGSDAEARSAPATQVYLDRSRELLDQLRRALDERASEQA